MPRPKFQQPYRHDHGPIINVNEVICEQLTFGQGEPAAHRRASNLAIVRVPDISRFHLHYHARSRGGTAQTVNPCKKWPIGGLKSDFAGRASRS
jgi:hypothetical protein